MNIFFREFAASSPISTGSLWLGALGARIAYALAIAVYGRLTSTQAWAIAILTAAWFATAIVPITAPLAAVVNAILLGFGAARLLGRIKDIGGKLVEGLHLAYSANTEDDLRKAGSALQGALDEYAMNALTGFVNEATFQALEEQILRVFPVPEWYSSLFDKGLFYRNFDPKQPVASGSRWFAALAARVALTTAESIKYTDVKKQLLLSASQLWVLGLLLAGWTALSLIPATAALADTINAILLGVGLLSLAGQAEQIGRALSSGIRQAYAAQTEDDLERAAQALAPALTGSVVVAIELLVSAAAFRAAEAIVARRLPVPEALTRRLSRRSPPSEKPGARNEPRQNKTKMNEQETSEGRSRDEGTPESRGRESAADRARRLAEATARLEGARRAATLAGEDWAAYALAGAAVLGVGAAVAVLARGRK